MYLQLRVGKLNQLSFHRVRPNLIRLDRTQAITAEPGDERIIC